MNNNNFITNDATISITGMDHMQNNEKNEDVVFAHDSEKTHFYGLADGQSKKKYCVIGGKTVLKKIADYIDEKGIGFLSHRVYTDETKYEIIRIIRNTIDELSQTYHAVKEEFSTTLVIYAVDSITGRYMIIHLGDGCVVGTTHQKTITMLSMPENGVTSHYTWLTTSENALFHLRIYFGDIKYWKHIYIMSDGMDCICYGKNISLEGKELLKTGNKELIQKYVLEDNPRDDATCIIINNIN